MYLDQSRIPQSGVRPSRSWMGGWAGVATIRSSSRNAIPRMDSRSWKKRPDATERTRFATISSPSPRTMTSIQGASDRTCSYMKVACTPPRTVTVSGRTSRTRRRVSCAL